MDNFHVVIDSNIFRQDKSFSTVAFKTLINLCKLKIVKLHIPEIVEREYISGCEIELKNDIDNCLKTFKKLQNRGLSQEAITVGENIAKDIEKFKNDVLNSIVNNWNQFVNATKATNCPVRAEHGRRVINAYFNGKPPYKSRKNRDDILDSFIFEVVKDLTNEYQKIYFISKDKNLCDHIKKGIQCLGFESIDSFLSSEELKTVLDEITSRERKMALIKKLPKFEQYLKEHLKAAIYDIDFELKFHHEYIPDDNHEAIVDVVTDVNNISLIFENVRSFLDDQFLMEFISEIKADVNYYLFKGDLHNLDEERIEKLALGEQNEHYYPVVESIPLFLEGFASIIVYDNVAVSDVTENDLGLTLDQINKITINLSSPDFS